MWGKAATVPVRPSVDAFPHDRRIGLELNEAADDTFERAVALAACALWPVDEGTKREPRLAVPKAKPVQTVACESCSFASANAT